MFYLHVSNRTENLLKQMAEIMRVDPQENLFARELFLIQSQGMERMIGQTLANEFGCFCNYQFFLPLSFLEYIAHCLGVGITPDGFQRQVLIWRLESLLRVLPGELYNPLQSYLTGSNSSLKRFQLARKLANLFDQYQVMRPEMLAKWERGQLATTDPSETWQMDLWRRLLAQPGGDMHRGKQLKNLISGLERGENFSGQLPKRIVVIGLHTLPPIFLHFLNNLSAHMDVHLFLLSPCRNYWGNVLSEKSRFKRMAGQFTLPPQDEQDVDHPLLATLGRQGRDLQNLMLEHADFALEFTSYHDALDGENYKDTTLLSRVQVDLLGGSLQCGVPPPLIPGDDSIQVVSCHSKFREMTVLKDHLLQLLYRQPGLELRDIIVMAPDIQEYAAIIPAIFSDIQHSVADRSLRRRNSIMAAFLKFLELFSGRYGLSDLLDILRLEVIYPQFQLSPVDLDSLQQWIIGAGIRWGLSGNQRREDGLADFEETSWRAGLDRMLMGYAIDSEVMVDGILPYTDLEGRGAYALGGLSRFVDIIDETRLIFQQPASLEQWSVRLSTIVNQLFGDDNEQELTELRTLVFELAESISLFHNGEVRFEVIREWFKQSAQESRSSSGFLRGQLTFCSMLPMRSIPFQVVCIIGLDDGVFPKNDSHDTFDLMGIDSRPGDRSARADDRYQFMEALLAARSNLYLSYTGQSIKTNEVIPPSVVLTELIEVLEKNYGAKDLVVAHPLHPFSKKYFQDNVHPGLFSYDSYYCRTAISLQANTENAASWWRGLLPEEEEQLSWNNLLRFYTNPQKYFIKDCLGIHLGFGEELPDDHENFQLSGLEKYYAEEEMVCQGLENDLEGLCEKFQTMGLWPLGRSGEIAFAEKRQEVEQFLTKIAGQQMGRRQPDILLDLEVEDQHFCGNLSNVYENGIMLVRFGKLRGRDLLSGWLHHLVAMKQQIPALTKIVAADTVISFSDKADGPDLLTFLKHFRVGCSAPSALFVEPAFDYVKQAAKSRARISPLEKALQSLQQRVENRYELEWELLLGEVGLSEETVLEFETLCQQLMLPIWGATDA